MPKIKVLCMGSCKGRLADYFDKVRSLHAKHHFELLIISGDLFSPSDPLTEEPEQADGLRALLDGEIDVPLSTYFSIGKTPLPASVQQRVDANQGEVCPNLFYLGQMGVTTLASGLRIANFGGIFDVATFAERPEGSDGHESASFTLAELNDFIKKLSTAKPASTLDQAPAPLPIDILLTHSAPHPICCGSKTLPKIEQPLNWGVPAIAELTAVAKPRYHLASDQPVFWEREPYTWPDSPNRTTRFLSLGAFAGMTKERSFYAFNIALPEDHLASSKVNATACPFKSAGIRSAKRTAESIENFIFADPGKRQKRQDDRPIPSDYICKICERSGHRIQDCPEKPERKPRQDGQLRIGPDSCWFCLSNPALSKHLLVSIGDETYIALPKGQLLPTSGESPSAIPGGGHVLIIPIAHYPSLSSIPETLSAAVVQEIRKAKVALKELYLQYSCQPVTFEIVRSGGRGVHAHIQVIPVPAALAARIEGAFMAEAGTDGVTIEIATPEILATLSNDYFKVELPDGRSLVVILSKGKPFNLQFGRAALSKLLGMPDRIDWKVCSQTDQKDEEDTLAFKAVFSAFDPY